MRREQRLMTLDKGLCKALLDECIASSRKISQSFLLPLDWRAICLFLSVSMFFVRILHFALPFTCLQYVAYIDFVHFPPPFYTRTCTVIRTSRPTFLAPSKRIMITKRGNGVQLGLASTSLTASRTAQDGAESELRNVYICLS